MFKVRADFSGRKRNVVGAYVSIPRGKISAEIGHLERSEKDARN